MILDDPIMVVPNLYTLVITLFCVVTFIFYRYLSVLLPTLVLSRVSNLSIKSGNTFINRNVVG